MVRPELWYEYQPGQRVLTREGIAGRVDEVLDGPGPGNETYLVTLDAGLGGGSYGASDLAPLAESTAAVETAASWYPELDTVLHDRLPPAAIVPVAKVAGHWVDTARADRLERLAGDLLTEANADRWRPDHPGEVSPYVQMEGGSLASTGAEQAAEDPCRCCAGLGEHDNGHECLRCDASGRAEGGEVDEPVPCAGKVAGSTGPTCPCGTPARYDPDNGWQHSDTSYSHVGEFAGSTVSDLMREAGWVRDLFRPPTAEATYTDVMIPQSAEKTGGWVRDLFQTPTAEHSYDWCFSGDTSFLTYEGYRTFKECAGSSRRVLDARGDWVEAEVKSFGVQRLLKLTLSKRRGQKIIYTTPEHKWLVRQPGGERILVERDTQELQPRDRLAYRLPRSLLHHWSLNPFGIAHGITYGDGTLTGEGGKGNLRAKPARLPLWGEKDAQLLRYFVGCRQISRGGSVNQDAVGVEINGLPRFFKERPSLHETPEYLYGWLAGYFAADGRVGANGGNIEFNSARREDLDFVQAVCNRLTITTYEIKTSLRRSCAGRGRIHDYRVLKYGSCSWDDTPTSIHTLGLVAETLSPEMFLIAEHRARFESRRLRDADRSQALDDALTWHVASVEETDRIEEVYCVVVPTTASFVLQSSILTGNCRFRRDSHCWYPKGLDGQATRRAGYAVWTPVDRGRCPRGSWALQQACSLGAPGPHAGGFTDATTTERQLGGVAAGLQEVAPPSILGDMTTTGSTPAAAGSLRADQIVEARPVPGGWDDEEEYRLSCPEHGAKDLWTRAWPQAMKWATDHLAKEHPEPKQAARSELRSEPYPKNYRLEYEHQPSERMPQGAKGRESFANADTAIGWARRTYDAGGGTSKVQVIRRHDGEVIFDPRAGIDLSVSDWD